MSIKLVESKVLQAMLVAARTLAERLDDGEGPEAAGDAEPGKDRVEELYDGLRKLRDHETRVSTAFDQVSDYHDPHLELEAMARMVNEALSMRDDTITWALDVEASRIEEGAMRFYFVGSEEETLRRVGELLSSL